MRGGVILQGLISNQFLLNTATAQKLYFDYAADLPIIDYHCHVSPKEIFEDLHYDNITQMWLNSDHYKWRLMRSAGVNESYITGDRSPKEKFLKFAEILPYAAGNPMYHWCHLELKRFFDWDGFLSKNTAEDVWQVCTEKLSKGSSLSVRSLITKSNVSMLGTTDDPCDDLIWHRKLAADPTFAPRVCPTFRPDNALNILNPEFVNYIHKLGEVTGHPILNLNDIKEALSQRIAYFSANGCLAADHGLNYAMFRPSEEKTVAEIFCRALSGEKISIEDAEKYTTNLLLHCAREYFAHGFVMQIHYSCIRNPNSLMLQKLGPDTGFDCVSPTGNGIALVSLLDTLYREGSLPQTIIYSLNPSDNVFLDTLVGSFQSDKVPGKIQHGSAWWFNDTRSGIRDQLISLSNLGILGTFVGMLTDSRSFLSYTRHEYFRRILCDLLGEWVERGEYPSDFSLLSTLITNICYTNAKQYFSL